MVGVLAVAAHKVHEGEGGGAEADERRAEEALVREGGVDLLNGGVYVRKADLWVIVRQACEVGGVADWVIHTDANTTGHGEFLAVHTGGDYEDVREEDGGVHAVLQSHHGASERDNRGARYLFSLFASAHGGRAAW